MKVFDRSLAAPASARQTAGVADGPLGDCPLVSFNHQVPSGCSGEDCYIWLNGIPTFERGDGRTNEGLVRAKGGHLLIRSIDDSFGFDFDLIVTDEPAGLDERVGG